MANTKQELILDALKLITSNPQVPTRGYDSNVISGSAAVSYDYILSVELSSFIYGFGLRVEKLENPQSEKDQGNNTHNIYQIQGDVGLPIGVFDDNGLPSAKLLIGTVGYKNIPSYIYRIEPDNKIRVITEETEKQLNLVYITKDVPVSEMSAPFKNGMRFAVAAEAASKLVPETNLSLTWQRKAKINFSKAKEFSIKSGDFYTYRPGSYTDRALNADVDGTDPSQAGVNGFIKSNRRSILDRY